MMEPQTPVQVASSVVDATTPGSILVSIGGALVLVLLIIAAITWGARRSGLAPRLSKGNQVLSVVCSHSLGQRERVIVIDMADKRLLIGVTPGQINCLATFDKSVTNNIVPDSPLPVDFQSTFAGMLKKRKTGPSE